MSNLTILKTSIRTYENLYSLTDLHIVSGSEKRDCRQGLRHRTRV